MSKNFIEEKTRKCIFFILIFMIFLGIYVYNCLTPYFTDDMIYLREVQEANGIIGLLQQEWSEWLYHNGRFVGQFNLRFSLWLGKGIFNILNSFMFTALILLIYLNVTRVTKYSIWTLLMSVTFVWMFAIQFGQTILWNSGSTNYLWGIVYVLAYITLFRYLLKRNNIEKWHYFILFIIGLLAGCSNENTSGGVFLVALVMIINEHFNVEKKNRKIKPIYIVGPLGELLGFIFMLSSPGLWARADYDSEAESYAGIAKYLSHVYKVTIGIKENFFTLLIILTIVVTIVVLEKKWKAFIDFRNDSMILFVFGFLVTSYALIIITPPPARAYFGAGIFLIIAILDGLARIEGSEYLTKIIKYSLASSLCLWMFFTYSENLVNLARVNREEKVRVDTIISAKERGDKEVIIPQYHPEFANPYTAAYDADVDIDSRFWVNKMYEKYYDMNVIEGLPYPEWEELQQD